MIGTDSGHCRIVAESISGRRVVDERTFASLTVLTERLQQLKRLDTAFEAVTFSPDVKNLLMRKNAIAIG